jgi:hypothetical protein
VSIELRRGVWMALLGGLMMLVGGASASAPQRVLERPHFESSEPVPVAPPAGSATSLAPPGF